MAEYDVVIVGASVAGTTAAALLAREGATVALLEKSPDPAHYKRLCTHEVVALANPVFERLGIRDRLREIRGSHRSPRIWSQHGWIDPAAAHDAGALEEGINVRREVLDPMLRELAADTPGVDLELGANVVGVLRDAEGRPGGVRVRQGGAVREITCRVVVGADGHDSSVAKLTGVRARRKDNARFGYAGYFEGVRMGDGPPDSARLWLLDPDIGYSFPTDGGLTLLAVAPKKTPERVAAFKADLDGEFRRFQEALSDGPDLSEAKLVGKYIGTLSQHESWRMPSSPGLAFIGDAAQTNDFVWGTGCGFAIASGAWLADAVGGTLAAGGNDHAVDRALRSYRREHIRRLAPHYLLTTAYSTGRPLSGFEHALYGAGARNGRVARAIHTVGGRTESPLRTLSPPVMARIGLGAARGDVVPTLHS